MDSFLQEQAPIWYSLRLVTAYHFQRRYKKFLNRQLFTPRLFLLRPRGPFIHEHKLQVTMAWNLFGAKIYKKFSPIP